MCIWRCEHARFYVEVFYALYINVHSFIHSLLISARLSTETVSVSLTLPAPSVNLANVRVLRQRSVEAARKHWARTPQVRREKKKVCSQCKRFVLTQSLLSVIREWSNFSWLCGYKRTVAWCNMTCLCDSHLLPVDVATDPEDAYNRIRFKLLKDLLVPDGVNLTLTRWIAGALLGRYVVVQLANWSSAPHRLTMSWPQGSPL